MNTHFDHMSARMWSESAKSNPTTSPSAAATPVVSVGGLPGCAPVVRLACGASRTMSPCWLTVVATMTTPPRTALAPKRWLSRSR